MTGYDNHCDFPRGGVLRNLRNLPCEAQQAAFGGSSLPRASFPVNDDETEVVDTEPPGFVPSAPSDPPLGPSGEMGSVDGTAE